MQLETFGRCLEFARVACSLTWRHDDAVSIEALEKIAGARKLWRPTNPFPVGPAESRAHISCLDARTMSNRA